MPCAGARPAFGRCAELGWWGWWFGCWAGSVCLDAVGERAGGFASRGRECWSRDGCDDVTEGNGSCGKRTWRMVGGYVWAAGECAGEKRGSGCVLGREGEGAPADGVATHTYQSTGKRMLERDMANAVSLVPGYLGSYSPSKSA